MKLFSEFLKKFYWDTAINFFEKFAQLSAVNEQLEVLLHAKKIQSLLTSSGNSTILRFYIIAAVSDNRMIKKFFSEIYIPYLKNNLDNKINQIEMDRLKQIQTNLKFIG